KNARYRSTDPQGDDGRPEYKRVVAAYLEELRRHEAAGHDCQRDADHEANRDLQERTTKHHADDVRAVCTECHAYTNFCGAAHDAVGSQSIDPYRGQD